MLSFLDRSDAAQTGGEMGKTKFERRFYQQKANLRFEEEEEEEDDTEVIDLSQPVSTRTKRSSRPLSDSDDDDEIATIRRKLLEAKRRKRVGREDKPSSSEAPSTPTTPRRPPSVAQPRRIPLKRVKRDDPAESNADIADLDDEEDGEDVIDLSGNNSSSTTPVPPRSFHLGGGYCLGVETIQYKGPEGINSSYDALKLEKVGEEKDDKKKHPINIFLPVKMIPNLLMAMDEIERRLRKHAPLTSLEELTTYISQLGNVEGAIDVSKNVSSAVPNVKFKLDQYFMLKGETLDWGKTPYDVLSFIRIPKPSPTKKKDDKKNVKPFVLSLPGKYVKIFHITLQFIAREKGYIYQK